MKIAYVTLFDATDIKNWSGTDFHIWKALEAQGFEIELIGTLHHGPSLQRKLRKSWGKYVERKEFLHFWDLDTARSYAADVAARIKNGGADVVLSPSPVPLAFLECPQPKILWTDATFAALSQDYWEFNLRRISSASVKSAKAIDRAVARNCDLLLFASDWGAEGIKRVAPRESHKVAVVPFGAHVQVDYDEDDIKGMVRVRKRPIQLLFVGVDWVRKGAEKAIEVTKLLQEKGLDAELAIVGCKPPEGEEIPAFVKVIGFIDKSTEAGRFHLNSLYKRSHFLIVPTIAEAYGLVFAEANAFGVPSLSHRVGGVTTVVRDEINGRLFGVEQPVEDWAEWISHAVQQPGRLEELALSSFREYQTRLNWDVAGKEAALRVRRCVAEHGAGLKSNGSS